MSDEKTIIASDLSSTTVGVPQRQRACLVQYNGSNLGKRYILDETDMVLGRSPSVGFHINEASVSRQHARFIARGNLVELEDLGSSNGTFINDKKLDGRAALKDGDMVRAGTVLLKFFAQGNIENVFHDRIYQKATIDPTTQIFNKQYLMDSLDSEFKVSRNYQRNLSIMVYDLDFFKKVNDVFGHNAGDFILKETAQLVKSTIRKNDILGRFGGEEFVIILPDTETRIACEFAERVRKAVEGHVFNLNGTKHQQTISIGVSQLRSSMATAKELLEDADQKLYKSKRAGRNRITA